MSSLRSPGPPESAPLASPIATDGGVYNEDGGQQMEDEIELKFNNDYDTVALLKFAVGFELTHPLHVAASRGDKDFIGKFLGSTPPERLQDTLNLVDAAGRNAITYAVAGGSWICAQTLAELGTDVNAVDMEGKTAILWAACTGNDKVIRVLLDLEADASVIDADGRSVFHLVARNKRTRAVLLLCAHFEDQFDPNLQDVRGMTPLHWAGFYGNLDFTKIMISKGGVMVSNRRKIDV